mmetsp:Transcript_4772/g.7250  ORF Transcript_4772/g.7250 Transcript_4772/m.7250 type:complete len:1355 (-) Transcript_4772:364-4428(-)
MQFESQPAVSGRASNSDSFRSDNSTAERASLTDRRSGNFRFWQRIQEHVKHDEIAHFDRIALRELCRGCRWMDMIPKGLVSSYMYLYHCVKGLGCEDGEIIEKDVLRTVGAVKDGPKVFGDTSDLGKAGTARAMHRVLTALSITDSMGYCQGMNYVVDFLLKMSSEEDSFCLFLYALRNRHICCLYETKLPVLSDFMEVFEMQLGHRLPVLAATLKERGFIAPFYSIEWFTTLFTLACPFDLTVAVWDLFFAGLQDVQLRCALAIMESLESQLLSMATEELLKEFRHLCLTVSTEEVVLRALRIRLVPVRLPSTSSQEVHMLDPRYTEDMRAEMLLSLRTRYLTEARTAMQERDADTGRWVKDRHSSQNLSRNSSGGDLCTWSTNDLNGNMSMRTPGIMCAGGNRSPMDRRTGSADADIVRGVILELVERVSNESVVKSNVASTDSLTTVSKQSPHLNLKNDIRTDRMYIDLTGGVDQKVMSDSDCSRIYAEANEALEEEPAQSLRHSLTRRPTYTSRDTLSNSDAAGSYEAYFMFLADPHLISRAYELKQVIEMCDRVALWIQLNQKWEECVACMTSDLSRYNMADHLLRYSITVNAHIRVVSFFLAVGGADPNSQDRWLRTPLHFAAAHNRPDVVRVLLLAGADPAIPGALSPVTSSHSAACLTTPRDLVSHSGSAASFVLREKSCVGCHTLFSATNSRKANCAMCGVAFCMPCTRHHTCVWSSVPTPSSSSALSHTRILSRARTENKCDTAQLSLAAMSKCDDENAVVKTAAGDEVEIRTDDSYVHIFKSREVDSSESEKRSGIFGASDSVLPIANSENDMGEKLPSTPDPLGVTTAATFESSDDDSIDSGFGSAGVAVQNFLRDCESDPDDVDSDVDIVPVKKSRLAIFSRISTESRPKTSDDSRSSTNLPHFAPEASTECDSVGPTSVTRHRSASLTPDILSWVKGSTGKLKQRTISADTPLQNKGDISGGCHNITMSQDDVCIAKRNVDSGSEQFSDNTGIKMTRKKRLSVALGIGFKKLASRMSLTHSGNQSAHDRPSAISNACDDDFRVNSDGVPLYWVGYRDDAAYLVKLQPWQALLLPLVFGAEESRNTLTADFCDHHDPKILGEMFKLRHDSIASDVCDICEQRGSECGCIDRLTPGVFDREGSPSVLARDVCDEDPQHLFFRREMKSLYTLLNRDARLFSMADSSLTHPSSEKSYDVHDFKTDDSRMEQTLVPMSDRKEIKSAKSSVPSTHFENSNRCLTEKELTKTEIVRQFMSGSWALCEGDALWVSDDSAWHCKKCAVQFTLFYRKHHCRRCGGVFCNDDAPYVDIADCLPDSFSETYDRMTELDPHERKQVCRGIIFA